MAKFTIAIPTFNRAGLLRRSLENACNQTSADVEVLVSDNASTDDTEEVVRSFGDRVRYHRNAQNMGMWPNFQLVTELASGDYFSWLQDDDLIHRDFARRAMASLRSDPGIVMYTCCAIAGSSATTFVYPQLQTPPVSLDWMRSEPRVMDGSVVLPASFFMTFSMPPVTAYRTDSIRGACKGVDPADFLFNERIIQSRAVSGGSIAVDPWPGGIFFKHDSQAHALAGNRDSREYAGQWVRMTDQLCHLIEDEGLLDWEAVLAGWLDGLAVADCQTIILHLLPPEEYWSEASPLTREICSRIFAKVPTLRRGVEPNGAASSSALKEMFRRSTPPILWDALKMARRAYRPAKSH